MEFFRFIFLFFVFLKSCGAQNLVAVEAKAKLPYPSVGFVAIYDGGELILISGGSSDSSRIDVIYSYNLREDSIVKIANFPNGIVYGSATFDNKGNSYYMGGDTATQYSKDIFKLDMKEQNLSLVGRLNETHAFGTAVNSDNDGNKTLLLSGIFSKVTCLDLNTLVACGSKSLLGRYIHLAAFKQDGFAYAFGDDRKQSIEKINLETMESELLYGLGFELYYPAVVSDGIFGYIIGGYFASDAGTPVDGIIRYDPQTNDHIFLQVENFPVSANDRRIGGSAVYVEQLNRIYMIGGDLEEQGLQDKIWYIDLHPHSEEPSSTQISIPTTTMNPDIFNCDKKPNGMYPHPYDCTKYIECRDKILEVYECPPRLLFNPITLTCASEQDVDCSINCSGKPNGFYPHPHSCELFISCHDEVLEVYKCPEPLLFHPEEKRCKFPDDMFCNGKSKNLRIQ